MLKQIRLLGRTVRVSPRFYSTQTASPNVWVVTDGGIESSLQAVALGKQLSGSSTPKIKTVVASKSSIIA
ncbi:hypothetical protein MBANPS3_011108 [Mucor bainieri]